MGTAYFYREKKTFARCQRQSKKCRNYKNFSAKITELLYSLSAKKYPNTYRIVYLKTHFLLNTFIYS